MDKLGLLVILACFLIALAIPLATQETTETITSTTSATHEITETTTTPPAIQATTETITTTPPATQDTTETISSTRTPATHETTETASATTTASQTTETITTTTPAVQTATKPITSTTTGNSPQSSLSFGGINLGGNRGQGNGGRMPFLTAKLNFIRQGLESLRNGTNQIGNGFRNGASTVASSGFRSLTNLFFNALRPPPASDTSATTGNNPLDILNPTALLGNIGG